MSVFSMVMQEVAQTAPAAGEVPIPVQTGWVGTFLLLIVWVFVAAVVLGPLIHYFKLLKPSSQAFADDRRSH
jgi:hypothetical protein